MQLTTSVVRAALLAPLTLLLQSAGMRDAPPTTTRTQTQMRTQSNATVEDGYDLWLRYRLLDNAGARAQARRVLSRFVVLGQSATLAAAAHELSIALPSMLGVPFPRVTSIGSSGTLVVATAAALRERGDTAFAQSLRTSGSEGFVLRTRVLRGQRTLWIVANSDAGALRGVFHLLRLVQTGATIASLNVVSTPRVALRVLDHWDNLNRSVERGYAGRSLWEWSALPDSVSPRYTDYARANASLGINGTVLTNVNADATVLTAPYLRKVAAIAGVMRPYGIKVYLTARFSAPIELGKLPTADPLDPAVRAWWKDKIDEIYAVIPDFGGFVVKANSEGQPGPQDYKRSHADGANMMAVALAPHGGVLMWRAFVYSNDVPVDRIRQAYDEFKPLDGSFLPNVLVQVKSGPLDFQPREPFHPLFGAMPKTPLMMEFQITKEYLGQDTHLVFMAPYFKEVLESDTYANGKGTTVAAIIDGRASGMSLSGIAGVANIGDDRNWTGSHFNQANWFAFGRLAWDPSLTSEAIATEWLRMTFSSNTRTVATLRRLMMTSREAVVNYMAPLGLAHIMATGHHYGPGAWADGGRADWTPSYYHRADTIGIGFDRTRAGSNALAQYAAPVQRVWGARDSVPVELLLWFHRVGWNERVHTGATLWTELARRYQSGVDSVRAMQRAWETARGSIDGRRFGEVRDFLAIQEREARWWRDASLLYFGTFARQPLPPGVEAPAHTLDFYRRLRCPPNRDKPRCTALDSTR